MPCSIAWSTTPIGSNSPARACANARRQNQRDQRPLDLLQRDHDHPPRPAGRRRPGRLQIGMVAGFTSEQRPASDRYPRPASSEYPDGTATWSLSLRQKALRQADDGLPQVSTYTIWRTLHAGGLSWQKSRTWCQTGVATRRRKQGTVTRVDPDAAVKRG